MLAAAVDQLARTLGVPDARLSHWLSATLRRLPYAQYYVFRARDEAAAPRTGRRSRTIAAFPTADDALAFAQRNGYGSRVRVYSLAASELLLRMLGDASISGLLFLPQAGDDAPVRWGPSLRLRRGEIVELLRSQQEETATMTVDLSAHGYDALRFGVDFAERARFRVALAMAVEDVVAGYVPPPGSLDSGPRSIFATGAVEAWLRDNGFPHAHQRRWVDVAGDPRYGGATELFEIDAGTVHSLLVQLFIHLGDDDRQFIKRINVTA